MKRLNILKEIEKKPLKFNEIKNSLNMKSNELSYHLKILKNSKLIILKNNNYSLTTKGKNIFPYLPIIFEKKFLFLS